MRAGELADAVDRIVIVERRQKPAALGEREALADVFQGAAGVEREDGRVVPGRPEEVEHGRARALDEGGRLE